MRSPLASTNFGRGLEAQQGSEGLTSEMNVNSLLGSPCAGVTPYSRTSPPEHTLALWRNRERLEVNPDFDSGESMIRKERASIRCTSLLSPLTSCPSGLLVQVQLVLPILGGVVEQKKRLVVCPRDVGSCPTPPTKIAEWRSWLARWAHNSQVEGSSPSSAINFRTVAHRLEQVTHNLLVAGSIPARPILSTTHNRLVRLAGSLTELSWKRAASEDRLSKSRMKRRTLLLCAVDMMHSILCAEDDITKTEVRRCGRLWSAVAGWVRLGGGNRPLSKKQRCLPLVVEQVGSSPTPCAILLQV